MPTDYTLEMDADIAAALRRQEEIEAEGYDRPMISLRWRSVAALWAAWEAAEDEERELRGYADRAAEQIEALIAERDAALARTFTRADVEEALARADRNILRAADRRYTRASSDEEVEAALVNLVCAVLGVPDVR